jgi:hypothetical protein
VEPRLPFLRRDLAPKVFEHLKGFSWGPNVMPHQGCKLGDRPLTLTFRRRIANPSLAKSSAPKLTRRQNSSNSGIDCIQFRMPILGIHS